MYCCVCKTGAALRIVGKAGYCKKHYKHAVSHRIKARNYYHEPVSAAIDEALNTRDTELRRVEQLTGPTINKKRS